MYLGDYAEDYATLNFKFNTRKADGTPIAFDADPAAVVKVYKANATGSETTTGVTLTQGFDGVTGLNHVLIDLSADAFYAVANDYAVVVTTGEVDAVSVAGTVLAHFSIENRFAEASNMRGTDNAALAATALDNTVWTNAKAAFIDASIAAIPTNPYTGTPPTAASIADAVWDEAATGHTDSGKAGEQIWTNVPAVKTKTDYLPSATAGSANGLPVIDATGAKLTKTVDLTAGQSIIASNMVAEAPTAADIADAVLDEAKGSHTGFLTTLNAVAPATPTDVTTSQGVITGAITTSQGVITDAIGDIVIPDPDLSGLATSEQATDIQGRLPAALVDGKMDSAASVEVSQEDVEAIGAAAAAAIGGIGGISWVHNVTVGGVPRADAWVGYYTDSGRTALAASGRTGTDGNVIFQLDAGTYYVKVIVNNQVTLDTETVA